MPVIKSFRELQVYQSGFAYAMRLFELSKTFPRAEQYSLTDQVRRSSRSVTANIAEAWGKRRYPAVFCNKLSDAEAEASETQNWIDYAVACEYLSKEVGTELSSGYDNLIRSLVGMQNHHESWCFPRRKNPGA